MTEQSAGQMENGFNQWAIVELSGRKVIAGRVSEETIAGMGMFRVDVPAVENGSIGFTRYYGPVAIYSITPVSEDVARVAARRFCPRPVEIFIPELTLPARISDPAEDEDDG